MKMMRWSSLDAQDGRSGDTLNTGADHDGYRTFTRVTFSSPVGG